MSNAHDKRLTKDEIDQVLRDFDQELDAVGYQGRVPLRAIGGYAMLAHGLRPDNPTTPDFDTSTPDLDGIAASAARRACSKHGLSPSWLNNESVLAKGDSVTWEDVEFQDMCSHAQFERADIGLKHIDLSVATIDALMYAKSLATCDIWSERGDKDLDDCISILEHEGIGTHDMRGAKRRFPFLKDEEFTQLPSILELANSISSEMRSAALQAHKDMIKDSGLDIPDIGLETDDFAFGYDDFDLASYAPDPFDDWY